MVLTPLCVSLSFQAPLALRTSNTLLHNSCVRPRRGCVELTHQRTLFRHGCNLFTVYRQIHSVQKAAENVTRCLPVNVQGQLRAVSMDYVPYLRTICKLEQSREASQAKRRWVIGLGLWVSWSCRLISVCWKERCSHSVCHFR